MSESVPEWRLWRASCINACVCISRKTIFLQTGKWGNGEIFFFHNYLVHTMFATVSTRLATSAQFARFFSKSMCGKAAALQIFDAGLKRADPYTTVFNYLKESKDSIDGVTVGYFSVWGFVDPVVSLSLS